MLYLHGHKLQRNDFFAVLHAFMWPAIFFMLSLFFYAEPVLSGQESPETKQGSQNPQSDYIISSINYKMVYVPPGTFIMGSPYSEKGRFNDETQHKVTLTKGFFIGITEITRGQWNKVMVENSSYSKDGFSAHPVDQVSWNDCQMFIEKINKAEKSRRYRLPTEGEWEYACRAGSPTAFSNGDITETGCGYDPNLDRVGWYCGNSKEKLQPVAKKEPNAWGIYDMHGNAWEWCQDWYEEYGLTHCIDPKGPTFGSDRVFKGGGWGRGASSCRSAFRDKYGPDVACKFLGFRIVREAD